MTFEEKSAQCRYCTPAFPLTRYCSEDCELKYLKVLRHAKKSEPKVTKLEQRHLDAWLRDIKTNNSLETIFGQPFRIPGRMRQVGASWPEIQVAMNKHFHRKWKIVNLLDMEELA